ncbi:MAG: NUDIX hydrolase [bacterium]|nr:NUDIX hydrolase [bacterium]
MSHQLFTVTQNAIIQDNKGRVLILEQEGKWMLPGGMINENEVSWLDALKREVFEETGISELEVIGVLEVDCWRDEKGRFFYGANFLCTTSESQMKNIKLSSEHNQFVWVAKEDLGNYNFFHEKIKKRIFRALEK